MALCPGPGILREFFIQKCPCLPDGMERLLPCQQGVGRNVQADYLLPAIRSHLIFQLSNPKEQAAELSCRPPLSVKAIVPKALLMLLYKSAETLHGIHKNPAGNIMSLVKVPCPPAAMEHTCQHLKSLCILSQTLFQLRESLLPCLHCKKLLHPLPGRCIIKFSVKLYRIFCHFHGHLNSHA